VVLDLTYDPTADVVRIVLVSDEHESPATWSQVRCDCGHWRLSFGIKEGRGIVGLVMPAAASQLPPEVIAGAPRREIHGSGWLS
jgi:hypothetical protein